MERFYVTVKDGPKTGWLLGPYDDHATALANVKRGETLARKADHFAAFYSFGTAKVTGERAARTVFGA